MTAGDLYARPSREEIARQVTASLPGAPAPERPMCACGHPLGAHAEDDDRQCETGGCGCGTFRSRKSSRPGAPPAVVEDTAAPGPAPQSHYCDSGNCEVCGDGTGDGTGDQPDQPDPSAPDPLANFAVHLSARLRALGWDQAKLMEQAGIKSPQVAARAINGTGVDLGLAGRIAEVVGGYLATMIGPYVCSTCHGEPPAGFSCLECGTQVRAS